MYQCRLLKQSSDHLLNSLAYDKGDFLDVVEERRREIKENLCTRKAITQICRGWRPPALKFRFEYLVIDSKNPETWAHVLTTLKESAVGRHVKRLELDAFDNNIVRLKSAAGILRQCRSVKYISLVFMDDTRRSLPAYEFLLPAMQQVDTRSLEQFHCNFGTSFEQATIIQGISRFSSLRALSIHSAFGFGATSQFDWEPLNFAHLSSLNMTTTKDVLFRCMGDWGLPSLRDLSIFNIRSVKTFNKFFRNHGYKLRSLDVTFIEDDSGISSLNKRCPNLQELIVSIDGVPYTTEDGVTCSLSHDTVERIGIRDMSINTLTIEKLMAVLNGLMRMFTSQRRFPRVQEVRLLDFQRALWVNIPWKVSHVELWIDWINKCESRMVELQAADGRELSFATDELRVSKSTGEYGWLSLHSIEF